MMKFTLSALALLASRIRTTHGLNNGLGKTPALGWNSWNAFAAELDEKVRSYPRVGVCRVNGAGLIN